MTVESDKHASDFTTLRLERIDRVLRVTIDHPTSDLNAVDGRLHHELALLFARLRQETDARAVVLTGRGRKTRDEGNLPSGTEVFEDLAAFAEHIAP